MNAPTEIIIQGRDETAVAFDGVVRNIKKTEASSRILQDRLKKVEAQLKREAATLGMTRQQVQLYDLAVKGASRSELQHVKSLQMQTVATNTSMKSVRMMRGGMGQLGYQIQDIAVQLQMGQNAMLIFGQQGSQIASIFGPQGAILGAFLAVGAAVGSAVVPALFNGKDAMKELEEAAASLSEVM